MKRSLLTMIRDHFAMRFGWRPEEDRNYMRKIISKPFFRWLDLHKIHWILGNFLSNCFLWYEICFFAIGSDHPVWTSAPKIQFHLNSIRTCPQDSTAPRGSTSPNACTCPSGRWAVLTGDQGLTRLGALALLQGFWHLAFPSWTKVFLW